MPLLINDANIFIDLEMSDLTAQIFALPYQFAVPDVLFEQELRAQHADLLDLGLLMLELAGETMPQVFELRARYSKTGAMDCIALALAEQEHCPLLTGDKALRAAAEAEKVAVHGTLWVVEELIRHHVIDMERAYQAYAAMEEAGRRLPFKDARRRLARLQEHRP